MSYSGIRILTTSPDAWSFPATPPRPRWRQGSSPAEGSSSFLNPYMPPLGQPSSSFLPPSEGEGFLLPPPRFHERRASQAHQMTSPTSPRDGYSFESQWS